MDLYRLTIHEAKKRLEAGEISSEELTRSVFERLEAVEPEIHAFLTLLKDEALEQACEADKKRKQGRTGPLLGIPVALKDLLCTKGVTTTCGSRILENFKPPYDATVVEKLRNAGAVFVGKTNMDEFAMGSSTEHSAYGPTKNPWDLERIPGGSSGGSAAATAADACLGALGSDTGGSIRQPAACCGIVGLKPTYGRVSRYGLVAFASSLDQIGPLVKDVEDCALMMSVIAGHDPRDSTSVRIATPDYTQCLTGEMKGVKVGLIEGQSMEGTDPDVIAAMEKAVETMKGLGAEVAPVSLPHISYGLSAYYLIAPAEAGSNLARYDGVKYGFRAEGIENLMDMYRTTRSEGFGAEVKRRIMIGTYALSAGYYDAYYKKACQVRTLLIEDFKAAFEKCDVLVTPTTPTPAFKIGDKIDDPLQMYLYDLFTVPVNISGLPGISVPCGLNGEGMPIGLHMVSGHFREESLLRAAYAYEQATDHHLKRTERLAI